VEKSLWLGVAYNKSNRETIYCVLFMAISLDKCGLLYFACFRFGRLFQS